MAEQDSDAAPQPVPPKPSSGNVSGGIAGDHARHAIAFPVAPTNEQQKNTLRLLLQPVACWRIEDLRFDFDSSFVRPEASTELTLFAALRNAHKNAPASVFGHADPSGDDEYNKTLSGRRARAIYALFVRDAAKWEELYSKPFGGDDWGVRSIQTMVSTLGFDPGVVDGKLGPKTKGAIKAYQTDRGLGADGEAKAPTRKQLFLDYMDALCRDSTGKPYELDPATDFLNKGADSKLRCDVQGCGEFNPLLVFSSAEDEEFKKAQKKGERDAANFCNRRVLVFLFPAGTKFDPAAWPCPNSEAGPADCKSQFFPDGDKRRSPQEKRRVYEQTHDTMACRFYDRMSRRSPCEVSRKALRLRLLDSENRFIANAPYRVKLASGEVREGQASVDGWLIEMNVETPEGVHVEWGYPNDFGITDEERAARWTMAGPYGYSRDVVVLTEDELPKEDQAMQHLANLGYPADADFDENLIAFQREYRVYPADGKLNDATLEALTQVDEEGLSKDEFLELKGMK